MTELIVVVAILVILMGIAIVLGPRVLEQGKEARVKMMFQTLETIVEEYRAANAARPVASRTVNHLDDLVNQNEFNWDSLQCRRNAPDYVGSAADPIEPNLWDSSLNPVLACSIERFVWATLRMPAGEELYKSFRPDTLTDTDGDPTDPDNAGDGFLEIRDPWGNKILYVARVDIPVPVSNESLQMREDNFLPARTQPYFVSAGLDELWGTWDNDNNVAGTADANLPIVDIPWDSNGDERPDSADNLFSFEAAQ